MIVYIVGAIVVLCLVVVPWYVRRRFPNDRVVMQSVVNGVILSVAAGVAGAVAIVAGKFTASAFLLVGSAGVAFQTVRIARYSRKHAEREDGDGGDP